MSDTPKTDVALPIAPSADAPTATYQASCHCGAFSYTVTASPPLNDPSATVIECNCSICTSNGYLFIYVPNDRIVFSKGSIEELRSYSFATKKMGHHFCGTCGASCMDVDLKTLNLKFADGKNYNPTAGA